MDTVDAEPAGYERKLRETEAKKSSKRMLDDDESTKRNTPSPGPPSTSGAPMPRSLQLSGTIGDPQNDESDDHTNPGVRLSDLKKNTPR
jgi:hypothetical protein